MLKKLLTIVISITAMFSCGCSSVNTSQGDYTEDEVQDSICEMYYKDTSILASWSMTKEVKGCDNPARLKSSSSDINELNENLKNMIDLRDSNIPEEYKEILDELIKCHDYMILESTTEVLDPKNHLNDYANFFKEYKEDIAYAKWLQEQ